MRSTRAEAASAGKSPAKPLSASKTVSTAKSKQPCKAASSSSQSSCSNWKGGESRGKAPRMRTEEEVLNRLRWDRSLDRSEFVIGYEDRLVRFGIAESEVDRFNFADIPLHRIRYFKRCGVVVWDRRRKIDNVFGSTPNSRKMSGSPSEQPSDDTEDLRSHDDDDEHEHEPEHEQDSDDTAAEKQGDGDDNDGDDDDKDGGRSSGLAGPEWSPTPSHERQNIKIKRPLPNCFLAVRLTDEAVRAQVGALHDDLVAHSPQLRSTLSSLRTLHVTVAMLHVPLAQASRAANRHRGPARHASGSSSSNNNNNNDGEDDGDAFDPAHVSKVMGEVQQVIEHELPDICASRGLRVPLHIELDGVSSFNDRVLYVSLPPNLPCTAAFSAFCQRVQQRLSKYLTDERPFQPHMTVAKFRVRPPPAAGGSGARASDGAQYFMPVRAYQSYRDRRFGQQPIVRVELCKLKALADDGFYQVIGRAGAPLAHSPEQPFAPSPQPRHSHDDIHNDIHNDGVADDFKSLADADDSQASVRVAP